MTDLQFANCKNFLLQLDDLDTLSDLREQTLFLFEKYFGFEHSIFWLCKNDGALYSPITRNTPQKSLLSYLNEFHSKDFLLPTYVSSFLVNKRVLKMHDVISKQQYENSLYYNDFMKPNGNYHEILVYLKTKNRFIGGISFVGHLHNQSFNDDVVNHIELISYSISNKLRFILGNNNLTFQPEGTILTGTEQKVCELLQKGLTNQEMANHLFVSLHTIKKHLQNIYKKLGVSNRTSLLSRMVHKS